MDMMIWILDCTYLQDNQETKYSRNWKNIITFWVMVESAMATQRGRMRGARDSSVTCHCSELPDWL